MCLPASGNDTDTHDEEDTDKSISGQRTLGISLETCLLTHSEYDGVRTTQTLSSLHSWRDKHVR